jgi:hypothetical protein
MKARGSIQYTIRQIPAALDKALRGKARLESKSLNEVALEVLSVGLQLKGQALEHCDLDFAIGSWVEDAEFDAAIRAQDQIDAASWQ